MAKVKLDVGATVDFLTKGELDDSLSKYKEQSDAAEYAAIRGIKYFRIATLQGTVTNGTLSLGTIGNTFMAQPNQGYSWSLKRVYVTGLNTADVAQLYRGNTPIWQFSGSVNQNQVTFGKLEAVYNPGEQVALVGVGSLYGTYVTLNADAIEVPTEMIGKLV